MEDSFYEDYRDALDLKNETGNKLAHCVKHYLLNRKIKTYDDLTPEEKQNKSDRRIKADLFITEFKNFW